MRPGAEECAGSGNGARPAQSPHLSAAALSGGDGRDLARRHRMAGAQHSAQAAKRRRFNVRDQEHRYQSAYRACLAARSSLRLSRARDRRHALILWP